MTSGKRCPASTNWSSALAAGYTLDTAAWITAKKDECYGNPASGASLSKVHTFMRQLRVVVLHLREQSCKINEEIKSVLKIREDVARSLDDLHVELKARKIDATIKRPKFIKSRTREAMVDLWERRSDNVKMNRTQMFGAQRKLRVQFSIIKEQLQKLARSRKKLLSTILERTRVLELFPEAISASMKAHREKIEDEKLKNHQMAMVEEATHHSSLYRQYFGKPIPPKLLERLMKGPSNQPVWDACSYTNLAKCVEHYTTRRKKERPKSSKAAPKDVKPTSEIKRQSSETQLQNMVQRPNPNQFPCTCEDMPQGLQAMTPECTEAIKGVAEAVSRSRANRKKILSNVEDCFLVEPIPIKIKQAQPQYGQFYGVACGGRCPRKHVQFYE